MSQDDSDVLVGVCDWPCAQLLWPYAGMAGFAPLCSQVVEASSADGSSDSWSKRAVEIGDPILGFRAFEA